MYDVTEGMTKRQQDRVDLLDSGEQLHRRRMLLQFLQRARIEEGIFCFSFFFSFPLSYLYICFLPPPFFFFFLLVMLVENLACSFEKERERELITSMTYSLLLARKQPWKCSLV